MIEDINLLRTQIKERAKQRYPKMRKFALTEKAAERYFKNNNGNLDDIVDELYYHIGDKGETPSYIKLMNE